MARAQRKVHRKTAAELLEDQLSEEYEVERSVKPAKSSDKGERVRVWWEPTRDKDRTGFAGAYWPAKVVRQAAKHLVVEYDNGERDKCDPDNIFPHDVPIDFGKEVYDLQVGEFVEVSNNSKTDPCAWLGCVASVGKKYLIDYPFHDSPSEYIRPELLRRARVWDEVDWKYIELGQKWKPGDVASPLELNLLTEDEYFQQLKQAFGSLKSSSKVKSESEAAAESEGEAGASSQEDQEAEQQQQDKQKGSIKKRSRKPEKPSRAALDEGTNGSGDDRKEERPKGAKKRKPSSVRQAHANPATTAQQHTSQPLAAAATAVHRKRDASRGPHNSVVLQQSKRAKSRPPRVPRAASIEVVSMHWRLPPSNTQGAKAEGQAPVPQLQSVGDAITTTDAERPTATAYQELVPKATAAKATPSADETAAEDAAADQETLEDAAAVEAAVSAEGTAAEEAAGAQDVMEDAGPGAGLPAAAAAEAAVNADVHEGTARLLQGIAGRAASSAGAEHSAVVQAAAAGQPPEALVAASAWTPAADTASAAPTDHQTAADHSAEGQIGAQTTETNAPAAPAVVSVPDHQVAMQPGSAAAPVLLTDLLQGLQQPVWLMPASGAGGQQQGPVLLLLPKSCNPGGAASAVAVSAGSAPGAAAAAGAGGAAEMALLPSQGIPTLTAATTPAASMAASPAAATASQLPTVPGPTVAELEILQTLSQLDLTSARLALSQQYSSKAYLMLVDCWRQDSPRLQDALRSYKAHVQNQEQPDYETFMVNIFGMEKMQVLQLEHH